MFLLRYKCLDCFLLMGARSVHYKGQKWVNRERPVCLSKSSESILTNIIFNHRGRLRQDRAAGERSSSLQGTVCVWWRGLQVDGQILVNRSLEIGEKLEVFCRSQEGNPVPQLSFLMNNQRTEEPGTKDDHRTLTMTLTAAMRHQGAQVSCTVKNKMTPSPVYNQLKTLKIKCE